MTWAGYWMDGVFYLTGEVVIFHGDLYIARYDTSAMPGKWGDWVWMGRHEPHPVDHPWIPEGVSFPFMDGSMSPETVLCRECWITRNYVMSFKPNAHQYVIQEMM